MSWIVLAGDYAYKVKRPVRFSFLDYSTVARRRAACRAEVELNRRWAPDLYLGVAELTMTRDGPRFDGPGRAIEPAVRMRRFDRSQELDALVGRGDVTAAELAELGTRVAGWQASSPVVAAGSPWGKPTESLAAVRDNLSALAAPAGSSHATMLAQLRDWIAAEYERVAPLLARRRAAGLVRECHGDLHTRNVVRIAGRLTPFDGIEFAPRLRFIDVASDVAFLAMDLERLGRPDLAAAFFDAWLAASGDYESAGVWRWFLVYRALVRAKIDALRAAQLASNPAAAATAADESRRFVAVALEYALRPAAPVLITCGPSGSGKSSVAAALVPAFPAVRLRADVERKRLAGLDAEARSGSAPGTGLYTPQFTRRTYDRLGTYAIALARAGLAAIVDATFLDASERNRLRGAAAAAGAPFAILACAAPPAVLRERVATRHGDASEATVAVLDRQLRLAAPLSGAERSCAVQIDTTLPLAPAAVARAVRAAAARPGGSPPGAAPAS